MDRDQRVRIYDLHAWTGITLGLFLFVVSFTGCLALFERELAGWEDPSTRLALPTELTPIHTTLEHWIDENSEGKEIGFLVLTYPDIYEPFYSARMTVKSENGNTRFYQRWNAETLTPIADRGDGLVTWILDIHRHLMWPSSLGGRTVGRTLVGIAGIIMMLSIISGLVTHRKMLQELFTLRINRSVRLKWKDAHNILGLWGLPFYSMIAFTGAFLGLVTVMVSLTGALVAKGDVEKLREVIAPMAAEKTGTPSPMLSFDQLYQRTNDDSLHPISVFVTNWGDQSAVYQVNYPTSSKLMRFVSQDISGASGQQLENRANLQPTAANRTISAITPLHYGTFGGVALKFLYLILGLSLCAMIVLGIMVWLERRLHSPIGNHSQSFYHRLGQLTVGITLGNMTASIAIFYLDKVYAGDEASRLTWTGSVYFLTWALTIAYAFWAHNNYRTVRQLLFVSSMSLVGLPLLNGYLTGDFFVNASITNPVSSHWVDISLIVLGISLCYFTINLPTQRYKK